MCFHGNTLTQKDSFEEDIINMEKLSINVEF
jgi:hypothetical protein